MLIYHFSFRLLIPYGFRKTLFQGLEPISTEVKWEDFCFHNDDLIRFCKRCTHATKTTLRNLHYWLKPQSKTSFKTESLLQDTDSDLSVSTLLRTEALSIIHLLNLKKYGIRKNNGLYKNRFFSKTNMKQKEKKNQIWKVS